MWNVSTTAKIAGLNARKEDSGQILALDIKVEGEVPSDALVGILGCEAPEQVNKGLWRDEEEADQRFWNIKAVQIHTQTVIHGLQTNIGGVNLGQCQAKKFSLEPVAGNVAIVTWTITVTDPRETVFPTLAEYLGEEVTVSQYPEQDELPL